MYSRNDLASTVVVHCMNTQTQINATATFIFCAVSVTVRKSGESLLSPYYVCSDRMRLSHDVMREEVHSSSRLFCISFRYIDHVWKRWAHVWTQKAYLVRDSPQQKVLSFYQCWFCRQAQHLILKTERNCVCIMLRCQYLVEEHWCSVVIWNDARCYLFFFSFICTDEID